MADILVSTDWLQDHLEDPLVRVFDGTTILKPDPEKTFVAVSGKEDYDEGHIPGAGFLELQDEFSKEDILRFTVPDNKQFAAAAGNHGISNKSHIVLYATSNPMWATRFWFLFRAFGHEKVSVLDGGWAKWLAEGRAVSQEPATYPACSYSAELDTSRVAGKSDVLNSLDDSSVCILNALGRDQFMGEVAGYGRPGRIKNSENVPWSELLDDKGCFLPQADLKDKLGTTNALDADKVISYCGGGIAATVDLFALALLGMENKVAVYDASLSEWARDDSLPMETD